MFIALRMSPRSSQTPSATFSECRAERAPGNTFSSAILLLLG